VLDDPIEREGGDSQQPDQQLGGVVESLDPEGDQCAVGEAGRT
jgi:hypothetical protein